MSSASRRLGSGTYSFQYPWDPTSFFRGLIYSINIYIYIYYIIYIYIFSIILLWVTSILRDSSPVMLNDSAGIMLSQLLGLVATHVYLLLE